MKVKLSDLQAAYQRSCAREFALKVRVARQELEDAYIVLLKELGAIAPGQFIENEDGTVEYVSGLGAS